MIQGHKPTVAGVALGAFGRFALHLNNLDWQRAVLLEMQTPKATHMHWSAFRVSPIPNGVWLWMRITVSPSLLVVDGNKVKGRLEKPHNAVEIQSLLAPWLR